MSDSESENEVKMEIKPVKEEEIFQKKPEKKKRVLSEAQLAALQKGRDRAKAKRDAQKKEEAKKLREQKKVLKEEKKREEELVKKGVKQLEKQKETEKKVKKQRITKQKQALMNVENEVREMKKKNWNTLKGKTLENMNETDRKHLETILEKAIGEDDVYDNEKLIKKLSVYHDAIQKKINKA